ncbi:MAG TPA: hypothetical protein VKU02_31255 [Gemmataceae bacterium]|nr:hypothetical protein [Gemmataceae bacterium]
MYRFPSLPSVRMLAGFTLILLAGTPLFGQVPPLAITKEAIESPTKAVIAAQSSTAPAAQALQNPKVQAGRVSWHPDFISACKAARVSGKPVLLFQMMGKLDEQFC